MPEKVTKEQLDALINNTVKDILKSENMLDFVQEAIGESLKKSQQENEQFKADLLKSVQDTKSQDENRKSGRLAARMIRALAANKFNLEAAAGFAKKTWNDEGVAKALSSSSAGDGGILLEEELGPLIELLRPASVVRSLNPQIIPMDTGKIRMPRHTSGSSGGWIGENENIPMTQPAFGGVTLDAKKYASLVPISNDLLRRVSMMVDDLVRDDLVSDIATATDLAFIRGVGTDSTPKGLRYQAAGANVFARQQAGATSTLAEITADLIGMIQRLGDANTRMLRLGWIMEWRTWARLASIRDGNGNLVFFPEMRTGTLFGFPFRRTSQIPRNLGGGDETELYLADFADVMIGETTGVLLDTSSDAAYHTGSAVNASFSMDQTVIRAIIEVDLAVRHRESVVVLTTVDWSPLDA